MGSSLMNHEKGMYHRVYDVVCQIPYGKVATYGQIAKIVGPPCDARRVGWALASLCNRKEFYPVPWQRVVGAGGKISLTGSDQKERLESEGIVFDSKGKIDLSMFGWEASNIL